MNEIIKKNGITYGIILGVFSILVTTIIYAVDLSLFTNMWVGIFSLVIMTVIGVVLVSKTKKELKNLITFKEAFTVFFIAGIIGSTISVLFNIVLFNVIDPEVKETIQRLSIESTVQMLEKFGTPSSAINETIEKMQDTDNFSPSSLLMGLVFAFLFDAILGLILALIFRTKPSYKD